MLCLKEEDSLWESKNKDCSGAITWWITLQHVLFSQKLSGEGNSKISLNTEYITIILVLLLRVGEISSRRKATAEPESAPTPLLLFSFLFFLGPVAENPGYWCVIPHAGGWAVGWSHCKAQAGVARLQRKFESEGGDSWGYTTFQYL